MTSLEPSLRDMPSHPAANAAVPAPRIVNGLTVRPRKQVNVWHWVLWILPLPDIVVLAVLVAIGSHRLSRYLEAKRV